MMTSNCLENRPFLIARLGNQETVFFFGGDETQKSGFISTELMIIGIALLTSLKLSHLLSYVSKILTGG